MLRRVIAMLCATAIIGSSLAGSFSAAQAAENNFYDELCEKYNDIEIVNKTEVRWWMAAGTHTDETIKAELKAMYDAGFSGVELCQLADSTLDESVYGYGGEQWEHDVKLILDTALDYGMTVSLTSGAGWSTANVPGLDPASQAANQCIVLVEEHVNAGASRSGTIPTSSNLRAEAELIGAVAVKRTTATKYAKDFFVKQTRTSTSDPTEFTIEGDFIIDKENTSICFGSRDTSDSFVMWQINTVKKASEGKVLLRPHVRANGSWKASSDIDVSSAVGYSSTDIIGKKIHIKIEVADGTVKTYFGNSTTPADTYTLPNTVVNDPNGNFTLGKLMFRQSTSTNAGTNEVARWDNLIVKDGTGKTVFSEDFENAGDYGFDEYGFVEDGMMRVGEYIYTPDSPELIVDSEYFSLQSRESTADPATFTVEGDFVLNNESTNLCFGTRNDGADCLMWQIKASNGSVLLRPHTRISKRWTKLADIDVTEAIGYTATTLIGKKVNIKIEVIDGKIINTYFDGKLASTYAVPDTAVKGDNGEFTLGKLMFRHKTSSKYSNEELAVWDNIVVKDNDGNTIFSENFENADTCGFAAGDGAVVTDGAFKLGVEQPEATAGDNIYEADGYIDLTSLIKDGELSWTAPYDRNYTIMYYYSQGTAQSVSPAVKTSYTINYFDSRGVEALKNYLLENVLNDAELNKKIKAGDVQFFMDSLEYTSGKGMTAWTENFAEEFKSRKGYDVLPYMYLTSGAPNTSIWGWSDNADLVGTYTLTDMDLNKKVIDDIFDVQTELYMEEFLTPFKEWLNSYGITLRAQISYGKNLEISEPISAVDYPEAENRNQNNQVDMYRLWSGGAHLQNKVLSSETGGLDNSGYSYTYQKHLQEAYSLYAAGYSRMIWHIWSSDYGPVASWPGYEGGNGKQQYYKFGTREPSYTEYSEFNEHLGRVQQLLREGKAGVDIGMLYTKYGQHMVHRDATDWMHTHETMFFPSTVLQDNGYTYDYLASDLLKADGVYFNKETKTLELAGYKALVLWQNELSADGASTVLSFARDGLPVVIVDGAGTVSPYASEDDSGLAEIVSQLKELANVKVSADADGVLDALKALGVDPYTGFSQANQQLLTQTRRDGDNRYIYAYNYCDGSLHNAANADHGNTITTELVADGTFVPYAIDAWTGDVTKAENYIHKDGKTILELTLDYGDVALFSLEATEAGDLNNVSYDGCKPSADSFEITDWALTVESWTPSDEILTRTETVLGVTTNEYAYKTNKTDISVTLDTLKTWNDIPEIGKTVSGKGKYSAKFNWDGKVSGAYIDFGKITQSMQVFINGKKTDNVNMNVPRLDVSDMLIKGENTIEIYYSTNLNNLQLSRGVIKEGVLPSNFLGYKTGYQTYGLSQATVVPYVTFNDIGHRFNTKNSGQEATAATCREKQKNYVMCDNCNAVSDTETVEVGELAEHYYENYLPDNNATCQANGTETAKCKWCEETDTREIEDNKADHKFVEYVYNDDATCCKDGTKTAKCIWCDAEDTVTDADSALGHTDTTKVFGDVKAEKWYNNAVDYCYTHGFTVGISKTEFGADNEMTRAMFITSIARIAGVDTSKNDVETVFTDVESGKWYTAAIKWANENGVVFGISDTQFAPNDNITREQIVTMLMRWAKAENIILTQDIEITFTDKDDISDWAKESAEACAKAGIINGYPDGTFRPEKTALRSEAAQILYKFHKNFVNK